MNQLETFNQSYKPNNLDLTKEKVQLLKNTVCKGATDNEFELFTHICLRTGLDPFLRQIYAIKRPEKQDNGQYKEVMSFQTGIDGYRLIAERSGKYSPGREPIFNYDSNGKLVSATAFIKKQTQDGMWHEVAATAFYSEYVQLKKDGQPSKFWSKMSHTMTAKCAESLALRKAFPDLFSGIYTKEEMMQSEVEDNDQFVVFENKNDKIIEITETIPDEKILSDFLNKFPKQDHILIQEYLKKYCDYWKKTISKGIQDYDDTTKFESEFGVWRKQHNK